MLNADTGEKNMTRWFLMSPCVRRGEGDAGAGGGEVWCGVSSGGVV